MARQQELGKENARLREQCRGYEKQIAAEAEAVIEARRGSHGALEASQRNLASVLKDRDALEAEQTGLREELKRERDARQDVEAERDALLEGQEATARRVKARAQREVEVLKQELHEVCKERDSMLAEMKAVDHRLSKMAQLEQGAGDHLQEVMTSHEALVGQKEALERELRKAQASPDRPDAPDEPT